MAGAVVGRNGPRTAASHVWIWRTQDITTKILALGLHATR